MSPKIDSHSFSLNDYSTLLSYTDPNAAITASRSEVIANLTEKLVKSLLNKPGGHLAPVEEIDFDAPIMDTQSNNSFNVNGVTNAELNKLKDQALLKIQEAMLWSTARKGLSSVYNLLRGSSSSQLISRLGEKTLEKLVENLKQESSNYPGWTKIQTIKAKLDIIKEPALKLDGNLEKEIKWVEENIFISQYHMSNHEGSMQNLLRYMKLSPIQKIFYNIHDLFSHTDKIDYYNGLRNMPDSFKPTLLKELEKDIDHMQLFFSQSLKGGSYDLEVSLVELNRVIQTIDHHLPNPPPHFKELKKRFHEIQKAAREKRGEMQKWKNLGKQLNNDKQFLQSHTWKISLPDFRAIITRFDNQVTQTFDDKTPLLREQKDELIDKLKDILEAAKETASARKGPEFEKINKLFTSVEARFDLKVKGDNDKHEAAKTAIQDFVKGTVHPSSISYGELHYGDLLALGKEGDGGLGLFDPSSDVSKFKDPNALDEAQQSQIVRWKSLAEQFLQKYGYYTSGKSTLERLINSM